MKNGEFRPSHGHGRGSHGTQKHMQLVVDPAAGRDTTQVNLAGGWFTNGRYPKYVRYYLEHQLVGGFNIWFQYMVSIYGFNIWVQYMVSIWIIYG